MKTHKRKTAALTKTRKSKRQKEPKDVVVSLEESSDSSKGKTTIQGKKMSSEHLGSYDQRSVICERVVAVTELKDSQIPDIVEKCSLGPICNIEGSANLTLVREFYAGIDRSTIDLVKKRLVTVVRGTRIVVTPDALGKFGKFDRPLQDEPHFPDRKGEEMPAWKEIWPTLCCDGCEPDERDNIYLRDLKRDFLFLHHMFWWNVNPKPPRRHVSKEQAGMLFAVYNGRKPDIALLWFYCIYAAFCNDHSIASLPLGVLLSNFMMNAYKVGTYPNDDWQDQKKLLGRATIGKSEGQSKLHRVRKTPAIGTVEGNNDMLLSLHEHLTDAVDLLAAMEKRQQRMEKRQLWIVERVRRMEKKQTVGEGEGKGKVVDLDSGDEDDGDSDYEDDDETETDGNDDN